MSFACSLGGSKKLRNVASSIAYADKGPGCGVGKVLFEGKSGTGNHLSATTVDWTVNGIVPGYQTFAMTSGILGCDPESTVKAEREQTQFIANNMPQLMNDIARGQGEYLMAYGRLLGCSGDSMTVFSSTLQSSYDQIVGQEMEVGAMLSNTKKVIRYNPNLQSACSAS